MRKILIFLIFIAFLVGNVSAAILTSDATPNKTFKCSPVTISATFDDVGITAVDAYVVSTEAVSPMVPSSGRVIPETQNTTVALAWNGTFWTGTFGNDATLLRGNRAITYGVTNGGYTLYPSISSVYLYSDKCTGTGKTNYTQIITPMGNYTAKLMQTDMNLLTFALYPYIQYWGFLFYFLVMATVVSVIYLKTQNITQPLVVGLLLLLVVVGTTVIPDTWRNGVVFIIALLIAVIYYRLFTRE